MKNQTTDIRKTQNTKGTRVKGGRHTIDTLPKEDVIIDSNFPDLIKSTVYKAGKSVTFETADNRSFARHLENKVTRLALRNEFPQEHRDFIFSGYGGTIVGYIAKVNEIEVNDVYSRVNLNMLS